MTEMVFRWVPAFFLFLQPHFLFRQKVRKNLSDDVSAYSCGLTLAAGA